MPTKLQIHKACRAKVKKAFAKVERYKALYDQASMALTKAHEEHQKKTGYGYGELESNQAFAKRMGPKEMERLKRLASCHDLANRLYKVYPQKGMSGCQDAAWKHLGWNSDCTKKIKPKATEFVANCPHCHKPNIFIVTKEEMEQDYDLTCDNDKCLKQSRISRYEKVA